MSESRKRGKKKEKRRERKKKGVFFFFSLFVRFLSLSASSDTEGRERDTSHSERHSEAGKEKGSITECACARSALISDIIELYSTEE